jgi:hypothetical protein
MSGFVLMGCVAEQIRHKLLILAKFSKTDKISQLVVGPEQEKLEKMRKKRDTVLILYIDSKDYIFLIAAFLRRIRKSSSTSAYTYEPKVNLPYAYFTKF